MRMTLDSWLRILASFCVMVGLAELAWSADQAPSVRGFESGPRPFSNPFAGGVAPGNRPTTQQQKPMFEEDDEDEDFEFPDDNGAMLGANRMGNPSGATNAGNRGTPQGGVSVGSTGSGVVSHSAPPNLNIDTETGDGSKEVVTDFNFPDADIMDIAKSLGKLTGKNFILDKDVKGRITIVSNGAITVGDAWKAFLTALDINGFALIPSGKFIRIARQRDARDKQLKTYTGDYSPDTDALITRVFPLKYLSSEEVARNFRSFMPANSRIIPYEQTNTVIVTDTGSNISKLAKLLEILDVEGYDAGIEVIPVKFASAVELSKLIDQLVPGTQTGGPPGTPRFGGAGAGRFTARRTKEGGIINTIIADERTNTLIVHANNKGADQVRELVAKLDQKLPATTGGGKVHVIYLQFAEAEQIANTLNNISTQGAGAKPASPMGGTGSNPVQQALFEGSIKVAPDKSTNSLVVTASPSDFVTVQRVVNRLDIPRDQVYAEVVIMEIAMQKNFEFSSNVVNPGNGLFLVPNPSAITSFAASPLGSQGATINFRQGSERTVSVGGQNVVINNISGLIKALQTNSNANILATPQILALDNVEATFESTEKIPVASSTVTANGTISNSINTQNVSLSIKIKPQINKIANFVKLDVESKLADIVDRNVPSALQGQAFATVERNTKTSVVVADGDTVVFGGLTRDDVQETVAKIPLLGDIPILGWLFSSRTKKTNKTNLLVFMTPHIVRQYESVRKLLTKKLNDRDKFIDKSNGGEDPSKEYKEDLVKSLPDINQLSASQPQKTFTLDEEEPAAKPVQNPSQNVLPSLPSTGSPPAGAGVSPQAPLLPVPNIDPNAPNSGPAPIPVDPNVTSPIPVPPPAES